MQTKDDIPRILGNREDWEGCEELGDIEELLEDFQPGEMCSTENFNRLTRAQQRRVAREYRKMLKHDAKDKRHGRS